MITKAVFSAMLLSGAALLKEERDRIGDIDSRFGDGDHGVTTSRIADTIEAKVAAWTDASFHDFIDDLGTAIMELGGGSAGPLYGTMIGGMAEALSDETAVDAAGLKQMLAASRDEMFLITKARVGDKTMMDALIPAVAAAERAPDDVGAVLDAAAAAARAGRKETAKFRARHGRARNYGEQTIGTVDAGALSTSLFFRGLADGFHKAQA
ncbi:MAG: DAK2 domain-containing protein [Methylobacteriaceae bacterium]|jgi:dihydroxyacetone kinase-like protein|nr:DAK2 domain-containing protein [Methylobacteriaceae bacterium]